MPDLKINYERPRRRRSERAARGGAAHVKPAPSVMTVLQLPRSHHQVGLSITHEIVVISPNKHDCTALNRPISVYRPGELPIQSCGQGVSAPGMKTGARLNAHTKLRAMRQRSAREAIYQNWPIGHFTKHLHLSRAKGPYQRLDAHCCPLTRWNVPNSQQYLSCTLFFWYVYFL